MKNSDHTWRRLNDDFFNIAFLNFTKKLKIQKFDYAVSSGNSILEIKKNEINYTKKLVSTFTDISVRESSSVEIIKKRLGINIIHVLDPALLLDKEFYMNLLSFSK